MCVWVGGSVGVYSLGGVCIVWCGVYSVGMKYIVWVGVNSVSGGIVWVGRRCVGGVYSVAGGA